MDFIRVLCTLIVANNVNKGLIIGIRLLYCQLVSYLAVHYISFKRHV